MTMGTEGDEWVVSEVTMGEKDGERLKDEEVDDDEVDDVPDEEEDKKTAMNVPVVPVSKDSTSKIFDEFRRLGFVSNRVPCLIRYIHTRRQNFIVTCNGKAFNTYVGQQLKLISVGGMTTDEISCMAADTYHVYTAVKNKIYAWRRGTELKHTYEDSSSVQICHLLPFGNHLISLDETGELLLWNIRTASVVRRIKFKVENFRPTCVMHPLSFLNKILIASSKGAIQIWNVNRASLVHHFGRFEGRRINAMVQAPSVGVVAIAFADKKITLFNFEYDKIVMTLECLDEPISIAFRLDNLPVMVVGSSKGSITAWDLNSREVICFNQTAHQAPVSGLVTFMGEPIFVSSSIDNSVKVWIFDKTDGGFRLLNSRDGHHKSPIQIRFQGERAMNLITTATDGCLRSFHLYNETYNRTINNFVPNSEEVKGRGVSTWNFAIVGGSNHPIAEDIVAYSPFSTGLHTFSFGNAKRGKDLSIPVPHKIPVSCVTLTACSQFAIVGFTNGTLHRYNMQSKILRREYKPVFKELRRGKPEVTGAAVDAISTIIASGGLDMAIRFWDFDKGTMLHSYECNAQVEKIFSRRNSNLFGVVLNSFQIWIFDFSTFSLVRELKGCFNPITDACMSPDCRWVSAATADGWVKTWDVPTSGLVDVFQLQDTVTSLEYSPSGEFLATTLSQELGILLWVNKTMYEHVSLNPLPKDFDPAEFLDSKKGIQYTVPSVSNTSGHNHLKDDKVNGLPVLSSIVVHKWKDLLQLEAIKERNKPKTPVAKPDAPFFIGSTTSTDSARLSLADEIKNTNEGKPVVPVKPNAPTKSPDLVLSDKLSAVCPKDAAYYDEIMSYLETLGPSGLDLAIRSMRPEIAGPSSIRLMTGFLELIVHQIKRVDRFESTHSFLALFLQVHHDSLMTEAEFKPLLEQIQEVVSHQDNQISRQMNNIICLTDFCRMKLFN